jgi:pimeloyl-ACP methyl ester carboxylesterase
MQLVAGRERIYLDPLLERVFRGPEVFWRGRARTLRQAVCATWRDARGFSQFAAFDQDAIDNFVLLAKGKLTMPVLAIGGEKSSGPTMAVVMRAAATDVKEVVIAGSGHWLMEEQPAATVAAVRAFLDKQH